MNRLDRFRWRIAHLVDKLPGQCWADVADFGLGSKLNPWSPQGPDCRADLARTGGCYCGKLRKPEAVIPHHMGDGPCPTCWVAPGEKHQLSCPEVTPEEFREYLAASRAKAERQARRDVLLGRAQWAVAVAVLVLAVLLVGGWLL